MIGLEVDPRLANKANKRKRAELYEKKGKVARKDPSKRVKLTLEQESVQKYVYLRNIRTRSLIPL